MTVSGWKKIYSDGTEMFFQPPFWAAEFHQTNLVDIAGIAAYHNDYVVRLSSVGGYIWYHEYYAVNQRCCRIVKLITERDRYLVYCRKAYGLFYHLKYSMPSYGVEFISIPYWEEGNLLTIDVNLEAKTAEINYVNRHDVGCI